MLVDSLAKMATEFAKRENIIFEDYLVGLKYSYVIINGPLGRSMGVSYMPVEDLGKGTARVPSVKNLEDMIASKNMQEKSLGTAAINAISQYILWNVDEGKGLKYENIVDFIPVCCPKGNVVVIGNMVPLVRNLREKMDVEVLERSPKLRFNAYPDSLAPRVLKGADVVIITGATLVNDSIDYILQLVKGKKFLVGPTAGIYPPWIEKYVDLVAGTKIENIEATRDIIKRGGGRWDFAQHCREYVFTGTS